MSLTNRITSITDHSGCSMVLAHKLAVLSYKKRQGRRLYHIRTKQRIRFNNGSY